LAPGEKIVIKVRCLQKKFGCKIWLQVKNQCELYGIKTKIEQTSLAFSTLGVVQDRATSFTKVV